jgi:Formiminotransferase domain, N-terminal subdomain
VSACSYDQHYPLIFELAKNAQKTFLEKSGENYTPPSRVKNTFDENLEGAMPTTDPLPQYEVGALVHAYADKVYNRSSYYLAGTSEIVLEVAMDLINNAVLELRKIVTVPDPFIVATALPDVGWVDHVAVMPLLTGIESRNAVPEGTQFTCRWVETRHTDVAHRIGKEMENNLGVQVYYYGLALKKNTLFTKVWKRRDVALRKKYPFSPAPVPGAGENRFTESALVGSPEEFVEQYNIRLTNKCTRRVAHFVARYVREEDDGLIGVDAYGHPYSLNRYEVMCSVRRPFSGGASVDDIQNRIDTWDQSTEKKFVEQGYRVGTTQEQSIKVIEDVMQGTENREKHDFEVLEAFNRYLKASDCKMPARSTGLSENVGSMRRKHNIS